MICSIITTERASSGLKSLVHDLAIALRNRNTLIRVTYWQAKRLYKEGILSAENGFEVFCPWKSQCSNTNDILIDLQCSINTSKRYLRGYNRYKREQQHIVATIVPTLLGKSFKQPSDFVFFENGGKEDRASTELALKIAHNYKIRTYDLNNPDVVNMVTKWLTSRPS